MPLAPLVTTLSLCFCACAQLTAGFFTSMPNSAASQDVAVELGGPEQRLGGDAAAVEAGAAQALVLLDERRLQPELPGADGRHVPARARTDDHHVERLSHGPPPCTDECAAADSLRPTPIKESCAVRPLLNSVQSTAAVPTPDARADDPRADRRSRGSGGSTHRAARTRPRRAEQPSPSGVRWRRRRSGMTEVLIVGGGVMGCAIALRLAQAGATCTVLERSIPGAEASSAAGGHPRAADRGRGPGPLPRAVPAQPRALPGLRRGAARALAASTSAYLPSGVLARRLRRGGRARSSTATVALAARLGLRAELLDAARRRARSSPQLSPEVVAAAHFPDDHQVDNRLLVRALPWPRRARASASAPATCAALVERDGRVVGVDLDGETLARGRGGGRRRLLVRRWSRARGSTRGRSGPRAARWCSCRRGCRSARHRRLLGAGLPGARARTGGVIAGSTMELSGFDKQVTAGGSGADPRHGDCELCPRARRRARRRDLGGLPAATPRTTCRSSGRRRCRALPRHRPLPQRHPAGAHHRAAGRRGGAGTKPVRRPDTRSGADRPSALTLLTAQ